MAGHSKWANIKHKKGKVDAKKGKEFSRVAKEIISAVKVGGPDPKSNPRLRLAILKAREVNMPNDNVDRNIKKASSTDEGEYFEMLYELYGHGGVGILVEIMTDNKNRISSDIRIATNKKGGSVANAGSVSFNFDKRGVIFVAKDAIDEDSCFMEATEAGASDFEAMDEGYLVLTETEDLYKVKEHLDTKGITQEKCDLEYLPKLWIDCSEEDLQKNKELVDWLEDLDDVQSVFHNIDSL